MTLQTIKQIDEKWTKDTLTHQDITNTADWPSCALGDNLGLSGIRTTSKIEDLLRFIDKKYDTSLRLLGIAFTEASIHHNHVLRKDVYQKIKKHVEKVVGYAYASEAQPDAFTTQHLIEEFLEEDAKIAWKNDGINNADERYAFRRDGQVEYEYDGNLGDDGSVEGEWFELATILTPDEAWDQIFQSDQFKSYLERGAEHFINGED